VNLTGNGTDYVFIDFRDVNTLFSMPDPGIPYYYDSELRVNASGTLVIDPGVILYGNTNAYINVYGKFKANGTVSEPVTFTNEPSNSHWRGFNFQDAAIDTACILNYSVISGANLVSSNYRPYEIPIRGHGDHKQFTDIQQLHLHQQPLQPGGHRPQQPGLQQLRFPASRATWQNRP
jgi:hypothetical protein